MKLNFQAARKKFHAVESEASKSSEVLKETLEGIKGKVGSVLEEASKTDIAKKAGKFWVTFELLLLLFFIVHRQLSELIRVYFSPHQCTLHVYPVYF